MKRLICWFRGHVYLPSYEYWFAGHIRRPKREQFRYTCDRCGAKTAVMNREQHREFTARHKPSWSN